MRFRQTVVFLLCWHAQGFLRISCHAQQQDLGAAEIPHSQQTPIDASQTSRKVQEQLSPLQRQEQANATYDKAVSLLHSIRTRSVSVSFAPSTSLFSSTSYTPLFNLIEQYNAEPLASIIRFSRRISSKSFRQSAQKHSAEEDANQSWSILKAVSRLFGTNRLLGDYRSDSDDEIVKSRRVANIIASGRTLSQRDVQDGLGEFARLLEEAGSLGKDEAWALLGDLAFWGRYGAEQNLTKALSAFKALADRTGDPQAQYMLGFLKSTNLAEGSREEGDQASALLYYTFSALGGYPQAEITAGYRRWVGIGTTQSCGDALPFYKSAADKAIARFNAGPPGGLHLPPTKQRLSDLDGGVFGPGASVASTGSNAHKHGHSSGMHNPKTESEWDDFLEFYTFHAERGSPEYMFRLGRIYYQGFGSVGAITRKDVRPTGSEELGGRDFARALKWFSRIARMTWPRDPQAAVRKPLAGNALIGSYDASKDAKTSKDEQLNMIAGLSSGYIGEMFLRGEGVPQDYTKAFLWFNRGSGQGDQMSNNALGLMYRDGLGVVVDPVKAFNYFQSASGEGLAAAQVNLGKHHLAAGEVQIASQYFEQAIRNGDGFQAFYHLAELHAHAVARPDLCPVAVAFYKIVAERGDWDHEVWWDSERAWARGDQQRALLGYWMMAERGYEVAQNNVAYILDQQKSLLKWPALITAVKADSIVPSNTTDRLALTYWTRSAAQDNVDALVKMGDYYLKGVGLPSGKPQPHKAAACYQTAAGTHTSAMAMFNLGWMHETGLGVMQDFHLAKRYYDLAYETNSEAYLPVVLSLIKLHARSVYHALFSRNTDGKSPLAMQSPFSTGTKDGEGGSSGSSVSQQKTIGHHLYKAVSFLLRLHLHQALAEFTHAYHLHIQTSADQSSTAVDSQPASNRGGQGTTGIADAQRALADDKQDPIQWAREARERELSQRADDSDDAFLDEFGMNQQDSDFLESIAIVAMCMAIGWLIYYRQARIEAVRAAARDHAQMNRNAP